MYSINKQRFVTSLLILFMTVSCSSDSIKLSKGERIFIDQLLEKENEIKTGKQLIFILNQSECQPCEEKIRDFYRSDKWTQIEKTFIVPENREPITEEKKKYVQFKYKDLGMYGLIRANGTVILLDDGNCLLLESIDLNYMGELEQQILNCLTNN